MKKKSKIVAEKSITVLTQIFSLNDLFASHSYNCIAPPLFDGPWHALGIFSRTKEKKKEQREIL